MKITLCLIVSFMLWGLFSCDNNSGTDKPISRTIIFDDTLNIALSFIEPALIKQIPMLYYDHQSKQDLRCELDSKEWRNLLSFVWNYTQDTSNIWSLTLYLDKYLNDIDTVEYGDIVAFQTYTIKPDNKLYHNIFVFKNNTFIELDEFDCETFGIRPKVINYFINKEIYYKNASPQKNSRISLFSDLIHSYKPHKYRHDFLMRRIEKYGKKYN